MKTVVVRRRGRRSTAAAVADPRPAGREAVWIAFRRLGEASVREVVLAARVPARTARTYLQALVFAGLATVVEGAKVARFRIVSPAPVETPRLTRDGKPVRRDGRERMWRTMKMLRTFTPRDLSVAASLPDAPVALEEAKHYARTLSAAGYLTVVRPGTPHGGLATYRFARNTGPKPPVVAHQRVVVDPNLREVVWRQPLDEASHG